MSRGLGIVQRRILGRIAALGEELPPLCWFDAHGLGFSASASQASSFRRAAATLRTRGLLQTDFVFSESDKRSPSRYFRQNRDLEGRQRTGWYQGARLHLVVRLPPDQEALDEHKRVSASLERAFTTEHRDSPWGRKYREWYYELPQGVWPAEDALLRTTDPRDASFAELARVLADRGLWDALI